MLQIEFENVGLAQKYRFLMIHEQGFAFLLIVVLENPLLYFFNSII